MFDYTNPDGTVQDRSKSLGVKVRLAQYYRRSDQKTLDIMSELKQLTDTDLADFKRWFESAGFPCN